MDSGIVFRARAVRRGCATTDIPLAMVCVLYKWTGESHTLYGTAVFDVRIWICWRVRHLLCCLSPYEASLGLPGDRNRLFGYAIFYGRSQIRSGPVVLHVSVLCCAVVLWQKAEAGVSEKFTAVLIDKDSHHVRRGHSSLPSSSYFYSRNPKFQIFFY